MNFSLFDNRKLQQKIQSQISQDSPLNNNRGYLFGDGFFTTGVIDKGQLLHQALHVERLIDSAQRLKFKYFDIDDLMAQINQQVKTIDCACIRITVSRQQINRGYAFSDDAPIDVCIQLSDLPNVPEQACELFFAQTPISSNQLLAGLKHLNRLDNVLAAREVSKPNQESLLCLNNFVIGGSRSNLFVLHHKQWKTPLLDYAGVAGITRKRVIQAMKKQLIDVNVQNIGRQELLECEAAFVTNSLLGIWVVSKIMDKSLAISPSENLKLQLNI